MDNLDSTFHSAKKISEKEHKTMDKRSNQSTDLQDLRQQVMAAGVDLTAKSHASAISGRRATARQLARQQAVSTQHPPNAFYDVLERGITGLGNALTLALMLLLANIALPVGILGLAIVEMQRVGEGVSLFDPPHAALMAIVAVAFYLVLLVVKSHLQLNASGTLDKDVWSLRLAGRALAYRAGIGGGWEVRKTTALQRLEGAIRAVALVIIVLGTVGSMKSKLNTVSGTWYQALITIFTGSSLTDFFTYLGGFVFTAALLAATHWGVGYAYERYARLRPDVQADADTSASEDQAEADYCHFLLARMEEKRRAAAPPAPFGSSRPMTEDPVSIQMIVPAGEPGITANGNGKH